MRNGIVYFFLNLICKNLKIFSIFQKPRIFSLISIRNKSNLNWLEYPPYMKESVINLRYFAYRVHVYNVCD